MLIRSLALFCLVALSAVPAMAQFGKPEPTPKSADEYFAERALRDASRLTAGVSGREIIKPEDGVNLARAEGRMEEALEIYQRLCGDRSAPQDQWARNCFALGDMYRRGMGTVQDYPRAKIHYSAACLEGRHSRACMQQAYIAQKGSAGEVDNDQARTLYEQACALNEPGGCAGLGNMMYMGLGGSRNRPRATTLLQDACAAEFDWACTRLIEYGLPTRLDRF